MFAVIKTGGKQYLVSPGDKLKLEKFKAEPGEAVVFETVLLYEGESGQGLEVGRPHVKGARVKGKVLAQARAKKVIIFKYKPKKRYKKKQGHRQRLTSVEITSLEKD